MRPLVCGSMTTEEQVFLDRAQRKYRRNVGWFEFEDFAFGMRSPLFSKTRSHRNVLENPLYIVLRDMWLQLGVQQGFISPE